MASNKQLPNSYMQRYDAAMRKIADANKENLVRSLAKVDYSDITKARQQIVPLMQRYCGMNAKMASVVAAGFYDEVRKFETGKKLGALAYDVYNPDATEGAVRALIGKADTEQGQAVFTRQMLDRLDYETQKAAARCAMRNGAADPLKPRFARVPTGHETCNFCLMLASRGAVYYSRETAGEFSHYHANCSCKVVPFFGDYTIEGYDPEEYYRQWKSNLREEADARAEHNGTTPSEELSRIMDRYRKSAERSRERSKGNSIYSGSGRNSAESKAHADYNLALRKEIAKTNDIEKIANIEYQYFQKYKDDPWYESKYGQSVFRGTKEAFADAAKRNGMTLRELGLLAKKLNE